MPRSPTSAYAARNRAGFGRIVPLERRDFVEINSNPTRFVKRFVRWSGIAIGMTPVKAALLSIAMLTAIIICGAGIYSADASTNHAVVDGYGISALQQD